MFTLKTRNRTGELRAANRADHSLAIREFRCSKDVRAGAGTGCLPAPFKSFRIRLVSFATDGTFTLYVHKILVQRFSHKVNSGALMGKSWDHGISGV
jgi:hypothetical protein